MLESLIALHVFPCRSGKRMMYVSLVSYRWISIMSSHSMVSGLYVAGSYIKFSTLRLPEEQETGFGCTKRSERSFSLPLR